MAKITFYGGAGSVTGANFLFEVEGQKILVDCGTNEREDICDPANHAPFPYEAATIDVLLVTHAHQDHIGRIPKLLREGFKGAIYSTPATRDISAIMFDDALNVMQYEAEKKGCMPIYDHENIARVLDLWQTHQYHEPFQIGDLTIEFFDAGHILGSAQIKISRNGRSVIFTGDLGNSPEPILRDTESPAGANYLVMESVYGDRVHEGREDRAHVLRQALADTRARGGTLLIPSFSVERTQVLLYEIHRLMEAGELERIPVYLDAPLATRVTEVFRNYRELLNTEAQKDAHNGDIFSFPGLEIVTNYSRAIHTKPSPKVIIAGAGMSSGGRIRSHEKRYLPDKNATVLFTGYQAPGSLGRRIQDGQKKIVIDGEHVKVRARISTLSGYSGHRDRDGLMEFVEGAAKTPEGSSPDASNGEAFRGESLEKVFVVMGEPKASQFLAQRIKDFLGVDSVVPIQGQTVEIDL